MITKIKIKYVSLAIILLSYFSLFINSSPVSALDVWQITSNLPYNLASHTSINTGDQIFVINGSADFRSSKFKILSNNPLQNGNLSQWSNNSLDTLTALIWHASTINKPYIYVLGGKEENLGSAMSHVKKVYLGVLNNGKVDSWIPLTDLPQALSLGNSLTTNNKIYYAGGMRESSSNFYNDKIYSANINEGSGTLGAWTEIGVLPVALSGIGMFTQGNNVYVIGGENSNGKHAKTYTTTINPDGTFNTWVETSPLPKPLSRAQFSKSGSKIFAIGGINANGTASDEVFFTTINQDGTLQNWQTSAYKIPQPTCCGTSEILGDYIYLLGGHNPTTGAYYDNVYFAKINDLIAQETYEILDVPYFSQNSSPWGPSEYDHAKKLNFTDTKFERWGCAVTSVAMVMRFNNINVLPNRTPIDPGSLNNWLKDNNGYLTGRAKEGIYSYLNFPVISLLTKQIYSAGKSRFKLEYYRETATKENLDNYLNINKMPVILKVTNSQTTSHFVVAKGKTASSYIINDPEWNYSDLTKFNNSFIQIDRFVPAKSDLSYIVIVSNPKTHILLTDNQGRKTGREIINGQINNFEEIPGSSYSFQPPISNPDTKGLNSNLGTGVNELLISKPRTGKFILKLSSEIAWDYEINIAAFEEDGRYSLEKYKGKTNNSESILIDYNLHKKMKSKKIKDCRNDDDRTKNKTSNDGHHHDHDSDCDFHHDDDQ